MVHRRSNDGETRASKPTQAVAARLGRSDRHRRIHSILLTMLLVMMTGVSVVTTSRSAEAATLPPDFQESVALSGLTNPTAVRFSTDGRVFVAEKSGVIKVFDSLTDTSPVVFADLNVNVHNFWAVSYTHLTLPTTPYV